MPPDIVSVPFDVLAGFFEYDHFFNRVAAAHFYAFIYGRFQWQGFTTSELAIGGDDRPGASVNDALIQAFCRKAAEHHRVNQADARAGLHCDYSFNAHRQVDHYAVTYVQV